MSHSPSKSDPIHSLLPKRPVETLTAPFQQFFAIQSSSGLALMACTVIALVWANSPWSDSYHSLWHTLISVSIGPWGIEKDLHHLINDGLMTIFFFLVGLEIKREIVHGELRDPRQASLPIVAALGGMVLPAVVFLALFHLLSIDAAAERGWAIPMATDIAFVVGVLAILGDRIPSSLKVLLLTLAIVDDLGAVLIIAFVFTESIQWMALAVAAAGFLLTLSMRAMGVRQIPVYVFVGAIVWFAVLQSGVHPTIAGVILGLMTPSRPWLNPTIISDVAHETSLRTAIDAGSADSHFLSRASFSLKEGISPLERLETLLHPWVAFGIMPLFALANAGVPLRVEALADPVAIAIAAGLAIGKPVGILLFSFLAIKIGLAKRPSEMSWGMLAGGACLAGIGFTMSIFLVGLALPGELSDAGKIGTLAGSLISLIGGAAILLNFSKPQRLDSQN